MKRFYPQALVTDGNKWAFLVADARVLAAILEVLDCPSLGLATRDQGFNIEYLLFYLLDSSWSGMDDPAVHVSLLPCFREFLADDFQPFLGAGVDPGWHSGPAIFPVERVFDFSGVPARARRPPAVSEGGETAMPRETHLLLFRGDSLLPPLVDTD